MEVKRQINIQLDPSDLIEELKKEVLGTLEKSNSQKNIPDDLNVIRLYGKQDLVKQIVIKKMYRLGADKLAKLEAYGLERYPFEGAIYYSISETEEAIKFYDKKKRAINREKVTSSKSTKAICLEYNTKG